MTRALFGLALVAVVFGSEGVARNPLDRNEVPCVPVHEVLLECDTGSVWQRTFPGQSPVPSLWYVFFQSGRVHENILALITFTPYPTNTSFGPVELGELAMQYGAALFEQNGESFQVVSREQLQLFGEPASQISVAATFLGRQNSAVFSTIGVGGYLVQFITMRSSAFPEHVDYQLHQHFVTSFSIRRGF